MIKRHKEFALVVAGGLTVLYHKQACFSIQRSTTVEKFTILCYNIMQLQTADRNDPDILYNPLADN